MWFFSPGRLGIVALLFLTSALAVSASATSYEERVREHLLPNGLKLMFLEDHKAPVAVFQIWYRVGPRNEVTGATGLSHLLEHMMFKGTKTVGPEEYSKIIQRNGGQTNAFTTQDYTTYFATIASDRLNVVSELEADRLANLALSEEQYAPERDVVMEERRMRTDNNPVSALFEQLNATAFVVHPYRFPPIGWMTDIDRSRLDDLVRHHGIYYRPNNAFIIVVGDFDGAALLRDLTDRFGAIPAGDTPPPVRSVEPEQRGERRLVLEREAELPFVVAGFHTPPMQHADGPALSVLSSILSGGKSSRLYTEMVYKKRLVRYAEANYDTTHDPNLFTVYAQPLPGKTAAEAERALYEEVEKIKRKPPTEREMQTARNGTEASFVFAQDSLFYQGMMLGQYEITGDWRRLDGYLPAIRAVTADDVSRVAREYLTPQNRTVATLVALPPTGKLPPQLPPSGAVH